MFKRIRYLGGKQRLLPHILRLIKPLVQRGARVLDAFSGSAVVSAAFRKHGYRTVAVDLMEYARILARRELDFRLPPEFHGIRVPGGTVGYGCRSETLVKARLILDHLNTWVIPVHGIFTEAFSEAGCQGRRFLTAANAMRLDGILATLRWWRIEGLISPRAYEWLLAEVLVAVDAVLNTMGHQETYLKGGYHANALKRLRLATPPTGTYPNWNPLGRAYRGNAVRLAGVLGTFDLVYLDPPYNDRQYSDLYHLLEAVAFAGQNLVGKELTLSGGKVPIQGRVRSGWSSASSSAVTGTAITLLNNLDARHLVMSYSNRGTLTWPQIESLLRGVWGARQVQRSLPMTRRQAIAVSSGSKSLQEWLIHAQR